MSSRWTPTARPRQKVLVQSTHCSGGPVRDEYVDDGQAGVRVIQCRKGEEPRDAGRR